MPDWRDFQPQQQRFLNGAARAVFCFDCLMPLCREMGSIVENWVEGETKRSPSVQCRITPISTVEIVSTHDQVLGGPTGQIFLGCTFPADEAYRLEIQEAGRRIGEALNQLGIIGRFGEFAF